MAREGRGTHTARLRRAKVRRWKKRIILSERDIRSNSAACTCEFGTLPNLLPTPRSGDSRRRGRDTDVMKFHLTKAAGRNLFTGYGDGYVSINDRRYEHPVIVSPEGEVER